MQTIKCVVVGDGAVGKVRIEKFSLVASRPKPLSLDLSPDFLHDEQIPQRICSNGKSSRLLAGGEKFFNCLPRCLITMRSP